METTFTISADDTIYCVSINTGNILSKQIKLSASIIDYKVDNFDAYYLLDKIQSKTLFNKSFIENEYERLKLNFNFSSSNEENTNAIKLSYEVYKNDKTRN